MPKLIISREGAVIRDFSLTAQRTTIGRKPTNDLMLDDQTVSSEHAAVTVLDEPFITDLGSTNGTLVNGERISKQPLRNGDVISIGRHELRFVDEQAVDFSATQIILPGQDRQKAKLHLLNGEKKGQVLEVDSDRTSLGKPGHAAALLRDAGGFRLLPMGLKAVVKVNGETIEESGRPLVDGDEITIAGTRIRIELA